MNKLRASYNAKKHYGKRQSEINAQIIAFGNHRCTIYQRPDAKKSSYYFRMYLANEKRHFRKSLGTSQLATAKKLAVDTMFETVSKVKAGERVLTVTLKEVRSRYDEVLNARKALGMEATNIKGGLSYNTWKAHRYRINHGLDFLQETLCGDGERIIDRRINSLDGKHWENYLIWRQDRAKKKAKTIRNDVVRDELLSIKKMFRYAKEQGFCNEKVIPVWNFETETLPPTRERMSPGDYMKFINVVRTFTAEAKTEKDIYNRLLLQHFALVIANSGMRSGELFGLKNKNVHVNPQRTECLIKILPETSKVRRGRELMLGSSRGGKQDGSDINYLIRWIDKYQIHKDPNDFVFPSRENGKAHARDFYYETYKKLRVQLAKKNLHYMDTYHLRHYWVTSRLKENWSVHLIAKVAGTSTKQIDETYSHVQTEIASSEMNQKRRQLEEIENQ